MDINAILSIQIALQSLAQTLPAFGTTLLLTRDMTGPVGSVAGSVFSYTTAAAVLADWGSGSNAYAKAQIYFDQNPSGSILLIGQGTAAVAQVDTLSVTMVDDTHLYAFTLNGIPVSYQATGGQTAAQIASALETAAAAVITAQGFNITAAYQATTDHFTLTSNPAGQSFITTLADADLTLVHTTPSNNGVNDLVAIKAASALGKSWYCLNVTSDYKNNGDLGPLADYIETQPNIFVVGDPNTNPTNTAGSFSAYLFGKKYNQTLCIAITNAVHVDAGLSSLNLSFTPGSKNWAYSQIAGVNTDNWTSTQIANLEAICSNYYVPLGNVNIFLNGQVGSGQYIDTILGRDWIKFNLQQNLLNLFLTTNKIDYDDTGLSLIGTVVQNTLKQAVSLGILAPSQTMPQGFVVNIPAASTISAAQKATRVFTACTWSGNLAGAINRLVPVSGTLGFFP